MSFEPEESPTDRLYEILRGDDGVREACMAGVNRVLYRTGDLNPTAVGREIERVLADMTEEVEEDSLTDMLLTEYFSYIGWGEIGRLFAEEYLNENE